MAPKRVKLQIYLAHQSYLIMPPALHRLNKEWNKFWFFQTLRAIQSTPPVPVERDESVTIVSMVSHATVDMYLLAVKSFLRHFRRGTVEIIDDGTLTEQDQAILTAHLPGVGISRAREVDTRDCPDYISWKRLFRILELAEQSYVIQLDSDTLTVAALNDVDQRVRANQGFVIGSERWGRPVDPRFMSRIARYWAKPNVQGTAEAAFAELPFFADGTQYLRGCAGFAGYPRQFATPEQVQDFSRQMENSIGPIWRRWGSEQVATLCLISKTPQAAVLPWPMYRNYRFPETAERPDAATLIHFIGTSRFSTSCYRTLAQQGIRRLQSPVS
jgi:hypothetical protein